MVYSDFNSYFYENGTAFRNKLNLHSQIELEQAANRLSYARSIDLLQESCPKLFGVKYLKHIHSVLFGDVYDWAGKFRTCTMARNQTYCPPEEISAKLDRALLHMRVHLMEQKMENTEDGTLNTGRQTADGLSAKSVA